ncbi:hypothetical protein [Evansella cellulosilytica]|nr:hypothetical protein [Evansella cellulosilytica]
MRMKKEANKMCHTQSMTHENEKEANKVFHTKSMTHENEEGSK